MKNNKWTLIAKTESGASVKYSGQTKKEVWENFLQDYDPSRFQFEYFKNY